MPDVEQEIDFVFVLTKQLNIFILVLRDEISNSLSFHMKSLL